MYLMPLLKGLPLELGIGTGVRKAEMMGLPDSWKVLRLV